MPLSDWFFNQGGTYYFTINGNLGDARRMGAEVGEYLGLPVVSNERVDP